MSIDRVSRRNESVTFLTALVNPLRTVKDVDEAATRVYTRGQVVSAMRLPTTRAGNTECISARIELLTQLGILVIQDDGTYQINRDALDLARRYSRVP